MAKQQQLDKAVVDAKSAVDSARRAATALCDSFVAAVVEQIAGEYPRLARELATADFKQTEVKTSEEISALKSQIAGIDLEVAARTALLGTKPLFAIDNPKQVYRYQIHAYAYGPGSLPSQLSSVWSGSFAPLRTALRKAGYFGAEQLPLPSPSADIIAKAEPYVTANNRLVEAWQELETADSAARKNRAVSAWGD